MAKRIISGVIYAIILICLGTLKAVLGAGSNYAGSLIFDAFVTFLSIVGTFEITRALKDTITKPQRVMVMTFGVLVIPACALTEYFFGLGLHVACTCFFVLVVALLSLLVFHNEKTTLESVGAALFSSVYPAFLLCIMVLVNHIGEAPMVEGFDKLIGNTGEAVFNANLAILLLFIVSPMSDVFAFFFGISLKKVFPRKLAPKLSPNKTVIGFIGGLIGGAISSGMVFFIYNIVLKYALGVDNCLDQTYIWLPIYMLIGMLISLVTCFGDLLESSIKRKKGIKDMGKIMPGHGGVMDRIDGMSFLSVLTFAVFMLV